MAGRARQEMPECQCRKNLPLDADQAERLRREKPPCPCRETRGDWGLHSLGTTTAIPARKCSRLVVFLAVVRLSLVRPSCLTPITQSWPAITSPCAGDLGFKGLPNAGDHLPAKTCRRRFSKSAVNLRERVRCMSMFEDVAFALATGAGLRRTSRAQATSASCLTLALSFKPRAETTFKMVSKLGLRSPDKAL